MIYLDTHVLVWLYAGQVERLPDGVRRRIEDGRLGISPMVSLELQYLGEVGRVRRDARVVVDDLAGRVGLEVVDRPLASIVSAALGLGWTRDPFDRMICAQAIVDGAPLLTADRTIHEHVELAVWD